MGLAELLDDLLTLNELPRGAAGLDDPDLRAAHGAPLSARRYSSDMVIYGSRQIVIARPYRSR